MEHLKLLEGINSTLDISSFDKNGALSTYGNKMLSAIEDCGGKSQTAYMDRMMTIGERPTPLGKARQILQEMSNLANIIEQTDMDLNNVYHRAVIKRCVGFAEMYKEICTELGVDNITEEMIEANQPKEHLMSMFQQALRAAVSNAGIVDEGNLRYANNVKLSVSECQIEVQKFLFTGKDTNTYELRDFTLEEQNQWLEQMWEKYESKLQNLK